MQQHEINTEVNNLLQKLTKCVEGLSSTGNEQITLNNLFKDELIKTINKMDSLDQRIALLEARNNIIDHAEEIIDVRPN
jgi:hypothetical protein